MEQRKQQAKEKPQLAKSVKFTDSVSHISNKAPVDDEEDDEQEEELVPMKAATFNINDESDDETQQINSITVKPPIQPSPLKKKIEKVSPVKKKDSVPKMTSIEESIVMPTPQVKKD